MIYDKINPMKKIFLVFGLFFIIGLLFPKNSIAGCNMPSLTAGCPSTGNTVNCLNSGRLYCCDTSNSCTQLQSGQITPTINNAGPGSAAGADPTDGCTNGINTAIGCIPVLNNDNGTEFAGFVLRWAIGVGSGIAFLLIVYASFMTMTSQGDPNRLKAGSELMTSAISGLLLLIFSIFVLKFIGIDILGLGAWGFGK